MLAKDLMSSSPPGVSRSASLGQVSQMLVEHDTGAVLVLADDGSLMGIITDGDLFRRRRCDNHSFLECCLEHSGAAASPGSCGCLSDSRRVPVERVMTQPVIAVPEDTALDTVAALLMQHGIRRIPVTRDNLPVGMLGRRDVLRALLAQPLTSDF